MRRNQGEEQKLFLRKKIKIAVDLSDRLIETRLCRHFARGILGKVVDDSKRGQTTHH